jgi:hypothetical protein
VLGNCFACAALALAKRLMTVRFVGVIEVLKPPASSGLLRPPTPTTAPPVAGPLPMPLVGESWLPLAGVALAVVSVDDGVPEQIKLTDFFLHEV